MGLVKIELNKLQDAGLEVIAEMFSEELSRCVRDLCERPGDDSMRTVTLEWRLKPVQEQSGVCTEALAQVSCVAKLPKQRTRVLSFGLSANGQLLARPGSLEDSRQRTLDELEGGE